jgi:hypothetical protein
MAERALHAQSLRCDTADFQPAHRVLQKRRAYIHPMFSMPLNHNMQICKDLVNPAPIFFLGRYRLEQPELHSLLLKRQLDLLRHPGPSVRLCPGGQSFKCFVRWLPSLGHSVSHRGYGLEQVQSYALLKRLL